MFVRLSYMSLSMLYQSSSFPAHQSSGDDGVVTRFLHRSLSLAKSRAVLISTLYAFTSFWILSVHLLGCLSLLRMPSTWQCIALDGNLLSFSLVTYLSNHFCPRFFLFSTLVTFCCNFSLTISLRNLSFLVTPVIFVSQPISATRIFRSSPCCRHQHSEPYVV